MAKRTRVDTKKIKSLLSKKTVGIAGCGGLGSNCAAALARIGVGKLIIADFDVVDASNLNRQYFFRKQIGRQKVFALADNIHNIDPEIEVFPHNLKLGPAEIISIFAKCDVIVEAFDLAGMKQMLIETVCTTFPDKPVVIGNGMAGWGHNNSIKTKKLDKNIYVCGDGTSEVSDELPPLAPRVGVVAHMQANTVLNILLGNTKQETL
jgi:sulfur carrier protein ThiS adenylyltransferase